jgi:hypothetical protein
LGRVNLNIEGDSLFPNAPPVVSAFQPAGSVLNAPMQGLVADLVKLAMINLDRKLTVEKLDAKMIMQVHDELVFEVHHKQMDVV